MTTTIYARQVPPEYQESPLFWGDLPEGITVYGNRHYKGIREEFIPNLETNLGDLADAWCDFTNERPPAWYDSWAEALADLAPPENRPAYTRQERKHDWPALLLEWAETGTRDERAVYCDILRLITGQEWDYCTLRGCCQRDWQNAIYRADLWSGDDLERLEAEYFNTGTEWIIHDDDTPPDSPEEINGYSIYCTEWSDDGIRQEIADAAGASPEAVKLYKFSSFARIASYEEA